MKRSVRGPALVVIVAIGVVATAVVQRQYLTPVQLEALQERPATSEAQRIKADDINELLADGKVLFLDVREPTELEDLGTIEGHVNIPLGQLEERLDELPKDRAILTA